MKKTFAATILALSLSLAYATPLPAEVDAAARAGDFNRAEQMAKELVASKPSNANYNYKLGQILEANGKHSAAVDALRKAQELDKSLSFASSPDKFAAALVKAETNAGKRAAPVVQVVNQRPVASVPEPESHAGRNILILLGLVFVGGIGYLGYSSYSDNKEKKRKEDEATAEAKRLYTKLQDAIRVKQLEIDASSASESARYTATRKLSNIKSQVNLLPTGNMLRGDQTTAIRRFLSEVSELCVVEPVVVERKTTVEPTIQFADESSVASKPTYSRPTPRPAARRTNAPVPAPAPSVTHTHTTVNNGPSVLDYMVMDSILHSRRHETPTVVVNNNDYDSGSSRSSSYDSPSRSSSYDSPSRSSSYDSGSDYSSSSRSDYSSSSSYDSGSSSSSSYDSGSSSD